jgi:hypothetical protein
MLDKVIRHNERFFFRKTGQSPSSIAETIGHNVITNHPHLARFIHPYTSNETRGQES